MLQSADRRIGRARIALFLMVIGLMGLGNLALAALPERPHDAEQLLKTPPPTVIQLTRVQLGAWRTAIEAAHGWDRIQKRAAGVMDGLSPRVVPADLPGRGTFYRLWVGPVLKASATRFCARLQSKHIDCIPAPGDTPGLVPQAGVYQASEGR
jgi:hypothetical protein